MDGGGAGGGPLRYELLGPLRAWRAGAECEVGPAMQRAVLAVLLLNANEPVSRDQLVQAVWGPSATANSPGLLATYVARLRRSLEPERPRRSLDGVLASRNAAYRLAVAPGCLDLHLFETARRRARGQRAAGDLVGCAATLDEALGLWRGGGLDGLPGPYAALHRGRLGELRLSVQEERFELALLLGRHHEVVAELGLLAARHPYRERLRAQLMLALHRAGRQGEALAVFAQTRQLLVADLGLEPGRELAQLHRRILCTDPGLELVGVPPGPAGPVRLSWRPAQLPSDLPDFTGRVAETRAVCRTLEPGPRIASGLGAVAVAVVSGPPGIGKTVLAVHAAHRLRERFPDGQLYASLHGADGRPRPAAELLGRFLADLGIESVDLPGELEQLSALFRSVSSGRRLLLVLDDAADAAQLTPLLPGSPSCAVLITSRGRRAAPSGARVVALGPLGSGEALRLLRRLLGRAGDPATAQPAATQAVLAVCDGLPLALRAVADRATDWPGGGLGPLAERFADERRTLAELSPGGRGVAEAFGSALARLRAVADGPAAEQAFRGLSRLDPLGRAEFATGSVAEPLRLAQQRTEQLLDLLVEHGLLQRAAGGRYALHPLAALVGRATGWTRDGIRMSPTEPGAPSDRG